MLKNKNLKKAIAVIMTIAVLMSMSVNVFAEDGEQTLSPEEQKAKEAVEQIKREMKADEMNIRTLEEQCAESILDEIIYEEYQIFCELQGVSANAESVELFSQYADENLNIEPRRASIGVIRAAGKKAASVTAATGLVMIGETFGNGFQDNPPNLIWNAGTSFSNQIKRSIQHANLVSNIKSQLANTSDDYWSESSSLSFDGDYDLELSLHAMDYSAAAEKISGTWNIYISFADTYDFDYANASSYPTAIVTFLNNWAFDAQELGALVPYVIRAYTRETY